jgi:hypothetical protein
VNPLTLGLIIGVVTLLVLFSGTPVAFALGLVAIGVLWIVKGWGAVDFLSEKLFNGLEDFTLVSIPMFVLMGAAVASSRAGADLYEAFARWFHRLPGSLVASNIGACALFAALTGSSPATCAAIGKMGIPEMQKRGYRDDLATGAIAAGGTLGILIPPSLTMILYGIASETSIGRLFLAGVLPGLMLTGLFMLWSIFLCRVRGDGGYGGPRVRYTLGQHLEMMPKVVPLLLVVVGVVYALYGGYATPSEAARRHLADLPRHDTRIDHDPHDHRHLDPVRLHDVGPARDAGDRGMDRRARDEPLGPDAVDQRVPAHARLLPAARRDHPDDDADPASDPDQERLRSDLVRRDAHDQHGARPHHAAGGLESLRHQRHRAQCAPGHDPQGRVPVHDLHDRRDGAAVDLSGDRDLAARCGDGQAEIARRPAATLHCSGTAIVGSIRAVFRW